MSYEKFSKISSIMEIYLESTTNIDKETRH